MKQINNFNLRSPRIKKGRGIDTKFKKPRPETTEFIPAAVTF